MIFLKNKFNFLILVIFLSSCSTMNVTQEQVSSGKVKTVNVPDVHIHRSQMYALPRADFCEFLSQLLEFYADPNYDVRTHIEFPEIKVRKF